MSGAHHLAAIYGSEQDKVNCSFYLKIGACRHGDRCSRKHIRPTFSQTLVIKNLYQNPAHTHHDPSEPGPSVAEQDRLFNEFYEDIFCELVKYGHLLELHVCDNVNDHLIGNVYVRYDWEDEAAAAEAALNNRWFAGRPLFAELSPVTDFHEACCRQNGTGECERGGFCNFVHLKEPYPKLFKELHAQQRMERKVNPSKKDIERQQELDMYKEASEEIDGKRSKDRRDRDRDRDRDRSEHKDRDRDTDRDKYRDRERKRDREHRDKDRDRGDRERDRGDRDEEDKYRDRGERDDGERRKEKDRRDTRDDDDRHRERRERDDEDRHHGTDKEYPPETNGNHDSNNGTSYNPHDVKMEDDS